MTEKLQSVSIPTFEELITTELKKYDEILPKVQELKDLFMNLEIKSIDDKDGYAKVKEGLKYMITKRNEIESKRKELKADSLKFGKAVDDRAKEIQDMIAPIEDYLRTQKDFIDGQLRAIKEKEEAEYRNKIAKRIERLLVMGFKLVDTEYVWASQFNQESLSLNKVNIESWNDVMFDGWCEDAYNDYVSNDDILLKAKKEAEEIERKVFLEEQAKLKEEQDRLKKEQEDMIREINAMAQERLNNRIEILTELGLVVSQISPFLFYKNKSIVSIDELKLTSVVDWNKMLNDIKLVVADIDKSIAEHEEMERKNAELLAKAKIEKEAEEARFAEIERVNLLGDKDKLELYIENLLLVKAPDMNSIKFKKEINLILDFLKSKKS